MSSKAPSEPLDPGIVSPDAATPRVQLPSQLVNQFLPDANSAPNPSTLPFIDDGRYRVEGEHARGGLGRILKARDHRLARPVAIKELIGVDKEASARFVREALVSARLQHPAIVPIYDAGRWPNGELFYAMKLISGRSLDQLINEAGTLAGRLALLPHVIAVADAIAYAHSQRVIHRDLKPANVLIGPFGETVVIDWGLAKDLTQPEDGATASKPLTSPIGPELTVAGTILGTPGYMPFEQAEGETVDERADVYALGAMLYHVLAGVPPYDGNSSAEVLKQVIAGPPPPLTDRQRGVPQDLLTIVRKAMARRKEDRYPSALELAEDLRRFQTGQLVSAHEYSSVTLFKRWLQRYRTSVSVAVGCLLLLLIGGIVGVRRIVVARNLAEQERVRAEGRSNELLLVEARASLERDPTTALAWLKTYPLNAPGWERVRNIALDAWSRGAARHVFRRDENLVTFLSFSPDGKLFAYAGEGKKIHLWSLESGQVIGSLRYEGDLKGTAFTPDGRTVAFVEWDSKTVGLWDLATGKVRRLGTQESDVVVSIALSSDGRWLASGSSDHRLRLWSLATGEEAALSGFDFYEGASLLGTITFSPNSRWLAFAGEGNTVHLREMDSGKTRILPGHKDAIRPLSFSPDSKFLVTGAKDQTVRLWDVATGTSRVLGQHNSTVKTALFSPDGKLIATGGQDRVVWLWDVATREGRMLGSHYSQVDSLVFSPNGQLLAAAGPDTTVRLWQLETGESRDLHGHKSDIYQVVFTSDGRYLASTSDDHTVRLWDMSLVEERVLRGHEDDVRRVTFSPDGKLLATASRDRTVRLWDVASGKLVRILRGHEALVFDTAFSPSGDLIASAGFDGTVRLWDVGTGASRELPGHKGPVRTLAFSTDGKQLATCGEDGTVRLWDVATGVGHQLGTHAGKATWLAFSPDGALLASAGSDHLVKLWMVATGAQRVLQGHTDHVYRVVFSHKGDYLVSSSWDRTVRLWNVSTGQSLILGLHTARGGAVAFSSDDRFVASADTDGSLQLWDLVSGASTPLPGHTAQILALAFSPTADLLASASVDHSVRLWDVATGACQRFFRHENYVEDVAFSPDGRTLASCSVDKTIRLWPIGVSERLPAEPAGLRQWMDQITSAKILANDELGTP